jgi:adenylate cyclase
LNGLTARFCGHCSKALKTTAAELSNQSWQHVLKSLNAKGGERKRLTILFADIRNSTELIDSLGDPEAGMKRLQPALERMKEAVTRYEGIVNKSQGDGVMAIFGAPQPLEDHAIRGCLAALALQDEIARLNDPDLQIRVGVHTGEVVVQTIEHGIYQTYDAAGSNVHLASRLEQMAEGGSILISKETYVAAKQFVEVEALGLKTIRGIGSPVEVFRVSGLLSAPSSGVFRSGIRLSPLIGRTDEFAALLQELENTIKGEGHVVGVVGEAGIGKSRLCYEFAENCRAKGIRVFEARVLAHGRATPFQPVLELMRDYFGLRSKQAPDVARRMILERLATLPVSEQLPTILLDFLGLTDPQRPTVKLDPKTRKTHLLNFVRVLPHSPREPLSVVVIEDLHWIDAASEEFVEALADAVVGTTTLLVVNYRPGFSARLTQRSHYRQINMRPLTPVQAAVLVQDQFGGDPSLALLSRNIIERAQGNPFFVEELINALVERGDFVGERGSFRLKAGVDSIPLPATVQAVIAARIDRLGDNAKAVLEIASVIGREISMTVLERIASLEQPELSEAIQHLRQAELLYDVPPFEQQLLAFRHPLIQEVAYRSLLHDRRRELHAKVAQAIESVFKDHMDERAALLAYHLEQAGENLKAAQQNMRSAVWIGTNDPNQAMRSWKKVRELLADLHPSQPINYLKMMAAGQIVNFGWREGILAQEASIYFEEAKQLAITLGDVRANALIHAAFGRMLANGGSADEYVEKIREAKALADGSNDVSVQIAVKAVLCHALRTSGLMNEALQMNIEATESADKIAKFDRQMLGFDVELWLTVMRGQTLLMLGRKEEARPLLDRIIQLDTDQIETLHHVIPSWAYVDLALVEGNIGLAQEHAERAYNLSIKSGNPYMQVYGRACRGVAHMIARRLTSAIQDLSDALSFARLRKAGLEAEPRILADLAEAYRLNGDVSAALATVDEAIKVAMDRHSRIPEYLARITHAHLLLRSSNSDRVTEAQLGIARSKSLLKETGAMLFSRLINELDAGHSDAFEVSNDRTAQS